MCFFGFSACGEEVAVDVTGAEACVSWTGVPFSLMVGEVKCDSPSQVRVAWCLRGRS